MDGVDGDGVQLLEGRSAYRRENVGGLFSCRPEEADGAGGRGWYRKRRAGPRRVSRGGLSACYRGPRAESGRGGEVDGATSGVRRVPRLTPKRVLVIVVTAARGLPVITGSAPGVRIHPSSLAGGCGGRGCCAATSAERAGRPERGAVADGTAPAGGGGVCHPDVARDRSPRCGAEVSRGACRRRRGALRGFIWVRPMLHCPLGREGGLPSAVGERATRACPWCAARLGTSGRGGFAVSFNGASRRWPAAQTARGGAGGRAAARALREPGGRGAKRAAARRLFGGRFPRMSGLRGDGGLCQVGRDSGSAVVGHSEA